MNFFNYFNYASLRQIKEQKLFIYSQMFSKHQATVQLGSLSHELTCLSAKFWFFNDENFYQNQWWLQGQRQIQHDFRYFFQTLLIQITDSLKRVLGYWEFHPLIAQLNSSKHLSFYHLTSCWRVFSLSSCLPLSEKCSYCQ